MSSPYDFFISKGWSPEQSAGITGNLMGESGLRPDAVGDNGTAYGIAQWHPDRQAQFQNVIGVPIQNSSLNQQLQFVDWELRNTESGAGKALQASTTLEDATYAFMNKYERPANNSSFGNRLNSAFDALPKGKQAIEFAKETIAKYIKPDNILMVTNPELGAAKLAANALGIGGKSWVQQIKDWFKETKFWQRLAIVVLALILIAAAFYLFGSGKTAKIIKEATQ